jgi:hypothetical protein
LLSGRPTVWANLADFCEKNAPGARRPPGAFHLQLQLDRFDLGHEPAGVVAQERGHNAEHGIAEAAHVQDVDQPLGKTGRSKSDSTYDGGTSQNEQDVEGRKEGRAGCDWYQADDLAKAQSWGPWRAIWPFALPLRLNQRRK